MIEYFKLLQPVADIDKSLDSIKDITVTLANKAGYHRGLYKYKNGRVRERAFYDKKFDDILTAKWMCFYKNLFISKLIKHPEFSEHHVTIINDVFRVVMQSLNLDKIVNDNCINKYVNSALSCKIGEVLFLMGSSRRLEEHRSGGKRRFRYKSVLNYNTASLDAIMEGNTYLPKAPDDEDVNPMILDLKSKLSHNKYGLRLLEALLSSQKKVMLNHIDDFVLIDDVDFNDKTKLDILTAYNTIRLTLSEYMPDKLYKKSTIRNVRYSFENRS
jgi:hypothetical protein